VKVEESKGIEQVEKVEYGKSGHIIKRKFWRNGEWKGDNFVWYKNVEKIKI